MLVPCSLPGPPVVSVFSPLRPGKGGWSLASQRWLEVNDLGRLVNRYGRRQWHPTPVLLPGKSHGRKSLVGCSPWGRSESGTTERLHFHISHFTFMHWRRTWQPTPVFLPREPQGLRGLMGCRPWGRSEERRVGKVDPQKRVWCLAQVF